MVEATHIQASETIMIDPELLDKTRATRNEVNAKCRQQCRDKFEKAVRKLIDRLPGDLKRAASDGSACIKITTNDNIDNLWGLPTPEVVREAFNRITKTYPDLGLQLYRRNNASEIFF